jgi:hypothetical protein
MDGDKCYGCQGTGRQIVTPKGQKKVKPTATIRDCKVGDIVEVNKVIAEVTSIKWIVGTWRGYDFYNQVVRYTRMIDGQKMKTWRSVAGTVIVPEGEDWHIYAEKFNGGSWYEKDRTFTYTLYPSEEMIGTEAE